LSFIFTSAGGISGFSVYTVHVAAARKKGFRRESGHWNTTGIFFSVRLTEPIVPEYAYPAAVDKQEGFMAEYRAERNRRRRQDESWIAH
jgi:hypothetical protein